MQISEKNWNLQKKLDKNKINLEKNAKKKKKNKIIIKSF